MSLLDSSYTLRHHDQHAATLNDSQSAASLRRTNEDMRRRIADLKANLAKERNRAKEAHRQKVYAVNQARADAEAERNHMLTSQRSRLEAERDRALTTTTSRLQHDFHREVDVLNKTRDQDEFRRQKLMEEEQAAHERLIRQETRMQVSEELEATLGREVQQLRDELYDVQEQHKKLQRMYDIKAESEAEKAETIRRWEIQKKKEFDEIDRQGRLTVKKELQEKRERENTIRQLQDENAVLRRKAMTLEADKGQLLDELKRYKEGDSWARRTPKKLTKSLGTYDPALTGGSFSTPARGTSSRNASVSRSTNRTTQAKESRESRALAQRATALAAENDALKREIDTLKSPSKQDKLDQLAQRNVELTAQLARSKKRCKEFEAKMRDLSARAIKLEDELKKHEANASRQRQPQREPSQRATEELRAKTRQLQELQTRFDDMMKRASEQQNRVKDREQEIARLRADVRKQAQAKEALQTRLDVVSQAQTHPSEAAHEQLKKQFAALQKEHARLQQKHDDVLKANAKPKTDPNAAALQDLKTKFASLKQEKTDLEKRVRVSEDATKQLTEELKEARAAKVSNHKLKSELTAIQGDADSLQAENRELKDQLATLRSLAQERESDGSESALQDLSAKLADLEEDKAAADERARRAEDAVKQLTEELKDARSAKVANHKLKSELAVVKSSVDSLESENKELKEQLVTLRSSDRSLEQVQDKLFAAERDLKKAVQQKEEAEREASDLQSSLNAKSEELEQVQQQVEELKQRTAAAQAQSPGISLQDELAASNLLDEQEPADEEEEEEEDKFEDEEEIEESIAEDEVTDERPEGEDEDDRDRDEYDDDEFDDEDDDELPDNSASTDSSPRRSEDFAEAERRRREAAAAAEAEAEAAAEAERERKRKAAEAAAAAEAERKRRDAEVAAAAAAEVERKRKEAAAEAERKRKDEEAAAAAAAAEAERKRKEAEAAAAAERQRREAEAAAAAAAEADRQRREAEEAEERRLAEAAAAAAAAQADARYYRVLYNYDPREGPNDDADEELVLVEGHVIKMVSDIDEDGFFEGEDSEGNVGLVPSNFVEEVPEEEARSLGLNGLPPKGASSAAVVPENLPVPVNVTIVRTFDDCIHLAWELRDNNTKIHGFELLVDDECEAQVEGASVRSGQLRYSFHPGTAYLVTVRSYFGDELSAPSAAISYTPTGQEQSEGEEEEEPVPFDFDNAPVAHYQVIYDYDPLEESPNDNPEEELPLRQGQLVKVYGEMGEDGFFQAEINGKRGLVPSNYLEPLSGEAIDRIDEEPDYLDDQDEDDTEGDPEIPEETANFQPGTLVVALYDYIPEEFSPNDDQDEELAFNEGDLIKILAPIDEDGFYLAQHRASGRQGVVPSNFIKLYDRDAELAAVAAAQPAVQPVSQPVEEPKKEKKGGLFSGFKRLAKKF